MSALSPPLCAVLSRLAEQREQVLVLPAGVAQLASERSRGGIAARDCCRWGILAVPNRLAHLERAYHAPAAAAARNDVLSVKNGGNAAMSISAMTVAVFPAAPVRQTCTGRPRAPIKVLDRSYVTLESDSPDLDPQLRSLRPCSGQLHLFEPHRPAPGGSICRPSALSPSYAALLDRATTMIPSP